jgi:mono/diheme cytochrome c family protein
MPNYLPKKIGSKATAWLLLALPTAAIFALIMTAAPASAEDLKAAAEHYADSCADCHGTTGKGDGPKAAKLSVKVGDLTDCAKMAKFSDDDLFKIVKEGGPALKLNKAMTGFSDAFEDNEIKGMAAYVRSLCGK